MGFILELLLLSDAERHERRSQRGRWEREKYWNYCYLVTRRVTKGVPNVDVGNEKKNGGAKPDRF